MSKLNQQYFETKEKHRKSVYKTSWIIWVTILVFILVAVFRIASRQIENTITEEEIAEQIENFKYAKTDQRYTSSADFEIQIKQGLYFDIISKEIPLMVVSMDTTYSGDTLPVIPMIPCQF